MIKEIYISRSGIDPLILENCTLFIRLKPYSIQTTFIFSTNNSHKAERLGLFNKKSIHLDKTQTGYFSHSISPFLQFELAKADFEEVTIIGYNNDVKFIIRGVNYIKQNSSKGFLVKFTFSDICISS